jgi:hypothetical protein
MSLLQASDHTFATAMTTRSEHSISLDEIDDVDDDDDECDRVEVSSYLKGCGGTRGGVTGVLDGANDDCSFSESTLHVFMDEWNDTTIGGGGSARFVKSLAKSKLASTHDSSSRGICLSSHPKSSYSRHASHHPASAASLNKSRRIASMLYESISEILHNSHGDMGILALDSVAKNLEGLAHGGSVEAQKETLASLLANGLRDLDELENRSAAPSWGPLHKAKQAMFLKQKDQLVGLLSDVFAKIEELNGAEDGGESRNDQPGAKPSKSPSGRATNTCDANISSSSSRPSKKRQSSFHSDVSSITSRTTASLQHDGTRKGDNRGGAMFNLPAALKSGNKSKAKPKSKGATSLRTKSAEASSPSSISRPSSPKRSPTSTKLESGLDITLQDSFSSFCAIDADDKTPKRPQRRGSFGGARSDPGLQKESDGADPPAGSQSPASATVKASSQAPRQPPLATRSLDDVVAGPRGGGGGGGGAPRRPGGRRKSDVRAAPPQRQRSFDGES